MAVVRAEARGRRREAAARDHLPESCSTSCRRRAARARFATRLSTPTIRSRRRRAPRARSSRRERPRASRRPPRAAAGAPERTQSSTARRLGDAGGSARRRVGHGLRRRRDRRRAAPARLRHRREVDLGVDPVVVLTPSAALNARRGRSSRAASLTPTRFAVTSRRRPVALLRAGSRATLRSPWALSRAARPSASIVIDDRALRLVEGDETPHQKRK